MTREAAHRKPARDGERRPAAELEAENAALRRRVAEIAKEGERQIDALLDGIGDAFYALDRDWRFSPSTALRSATSADPARRCWAGQSGTCFPGPKARTCAGAWKS